MKNISIIGAGNMGTAFAVGLAEAGYNVRIADRSSDKLDRLKNVPGVTTFPPDAMVFDDADMIIIAVQPVDFASVISSIGSRLNYNRTIVASLIPSMSLEDIEQLLRPYNKAPMIARVMPNTAVAVCESMTFVCLNDYAAPFSTEINDLFAAVGKSEIVSESLFDGAMMLCSCGLAYALRYVRASSEGGVRLGFDANDACRYVCQTLRGAAAMIERFNLHPEAAIDTVTTPGGITIRGLIAMEKAGFSSAVIAGLDSPTKL